MIKKIKNKLEFVVIKIKIYLIIQNQFINYCLMLCIILVCYYLFINLSFCENNIFSEIQEIKNFSDCDCFKYLKHGEFLRIPEKIDPSKLNLLQYILLNSKSHLIIFDDDFSSFRCDCNCNYCWSYKIRYFGSFFWTMLIILLKISF